MAIVIQKPKRELDTLSLHQNCEKTIKESIEEKTLKSLLVPLGGI